MRSFFQSITAIATRLSSPPLRERQTKRPLADWAERGIFIRSSPLSVLWLRLQACLSRRGRDDGTNRKINTHFLCISLFLTFISAQAATSPTAPQPQYFIPTHQAPAGFSNINPDDPQTTLISVYYGNNLLINTLASFNSQNITFKNPQEILNNLSNLNLNLDSKNLDLLKLNLTQTQPNHQNLLCTDGTGNFCQALNPKIIGVIFDPNTYKAYLFINPNFIQIKPNQNNLPNSTAGFSTLLNNSLLISHDQLNTYALNTEGFVAQGDGYFSSKIYYTHQDSNGSNGSNNNPDSLDITEAAEHYYHRENLYSAGLLPSSGSGLFNQSVSMIGAQFQNHYEPAGLSFAGQGSPVVIYLSMPSQVQVYKDNNLIYVSNLPAGKQSLDTSSFPLGSYDLDIKITNTLQQVQEQHQIFIKRANSTDLNLTKYSISLGAIEKNDPSIQQNNSNTGNTQLPQISDQGLIGLDRVQMLNDFLEWDEHLLSNFSRSFLDSELTYFGNHYQINPAALISTNGQYGFGASANYQYQNLYFALNSARLYGTAHEFNTQQENNNLIIDPNTGLPIENSQNSNASQSFMPLSSTEYYLSANTNLTWHDDQYSVLTLWQKDVFGDYSQSSSFSYTHPIMKSPSISSNLIFNLSHSTYDSLISIGIQFDFLTQYFNGDAIMGYQDQKNNNINTNNNEGMMASASVNHQVQFDSTHLLNWSFNTQENPGSSSSAADLDYTSNPFRARADYLHSNLNSTSSQAAYQYDLYSLELDSSLAYSSGKLGIGYPNSKNSGVLIDIHSPESGSTEILSDNQPIAIVSNNFPTPIFLDPYKTYNLSINPLGSNMQYGFDTSPKTVTLYTGNLQDLEWTLEKHRILFVQIINPKHQPLGQLLLDIKNKYDTTDDQGYLQTEIPESLKTLKFISESGERCEINLPKDLPLDHGLTVLDQALICNLK